MYAFMWPVLTHGRRQALAEPRERRAGKHISMHRRSSVNAGAQAAGAHPGNLTQAQRPGRPP